MIELFCPPPPRPALEVEAINTNKYQVGHFQTNCLMLLLFKEVALQFPVWQEMNCPVAPPPLKQA